MSANVEPDPVRSGGPLGRFHWQSMLWQRRPELLSIGAVVVALATQLSLTRYKDTVPHSAFGFVIAIALLASAALIQARRPVAATSTFEFKLTRRIEIALLAIVLIIAIFFRFWHLLSFPPGLWSDEGVNALDAVSLIDGDHTRIWFDTVFGRSTLYLYLLAASFKVFGYTLLAIRIVPALAGLAAVIAFYPLARHLFGAIPAIVATALLAASRWAVTFSRISWEASIQPVLEILAIYFIVRGLEKKSRLSFALGGVALAAGLYSYIAFRMMPIFVALLLVYIAATQWRLIRSNAAGLAIFVLAFVAAVAPLANFAQHNQDRFLERTREVNVFTEIDHEGSYEPLRHNIRTSLEMINVRGDVNGRHNLPGAPMVDDVTAALFVLGLAVSVWSLRNWRRGALAPWFGLSLVPGALTLRIENPSGIRDIGAIPPLYLLVGLAVATIYRPLSATRGGLLIFGVLAASLVAGGTAFNYDELFRQQVHNKDVYDGFTPAFTDVAKLVASDADANRVYVSQEFANYNAVRVLTHGEHYTPYTAAYNLVFPRGDQNVLLILDDNQVAIVATLQRLYPNLRRDDHFDPFGRLNFTSVTIPESDIAASHNLAATRSSGGGPPTQVSLPLDHEWTAEDLAQGPVDVTWAGYIWVTASPGDAVVTLAVPGTAASLAVDGLPVSITGDAGNATLGPLSIGEHRIAIAAHITMPGRVKMQLAVGAGSPVKGPDASDVLYGTSVGTGGFQVAYRAGSDFASDPVATARVPFAVPAPGITNAAEVEYRGTLDVPAGGTYGFALDGVASAQLFVDDDLVVDNGGGHPRLRVEASVDLSAGPHTVSIQYTAGGQLDWSLWLRKPAGDWQRADGSEFRVPDGPFRTTPSVTIAPASAPWPAGGAAYDGLDVPTGIAVLPDGTVVAGGGNKIVLIDPSGRAQRTITVDVKEIDDLDVTSSGQIVVVDNAGGSLVLLSTDGQVIKRFDGAFSTAYGVGVSGNTAYVASPSGGAIYKVPLPDGPVTVLPISDAEAVGHPKQPSDVAIGPDGAFYIIDFERRNVVRSPDGATGRAFRGVGGTGTQVPHLAVFGSLVLVTDPVNQRIVVYDTAGKQRGVYIFPSKTNGTRPIGIAVAPDGTIYVADQSGTVLSLKLTIPPATAADIAGLP